MIAEGRRSRLPLLALLAFFFGLYLYVQYRWFPHLSKNNDEAVYLFQAEMLRDGRLTLPAAELGASFRPWMSGVLGDRTVMVFPPGWPAALALGLTLFGSFKVVGALAAVFGVFGVYLLAAELLDDRRAALVAAALVGLSPLMLVLGGTVLSYPFALGLGSTAAAMVLRAVRLDRPRWLVAAGAAAGLLLATRPLDAVLVSAIFGAYLLWSWCPRLASVVRGLGWAIAGALPFVAIVAATNRRVTGSALTFPLQANGGDNRMGFGLRTISAGARVYDVTPALMQRTTGRLLGQMPHWTLGGLVVVPLVVWGAVRLWRRRPTSVPLLVVFGVAFPVAYVFYWGTYFVWVGRRDYGPFYYLPALVPLAIATADGLAGLARRSRMVAVVVVVGLVALLPASIAPKARRAEKHNAAVAREVRLVERLPRASLVILPASNEGPWMLHVRGYFRNTPSIDGDRVYAADHGVENLSLFDRFPDRPIHQLFGVLPGDRVEGNPDPVIERLERLEGTKIEFASSFTNTTSNPTVVAYLGTPAGYVRCVLDENSDAGRTYEATWKVSASGVTPPDGCTPLPTLPQANSRTLVGNVVVGFSASATFELDGVNRWENLYASRAGGSGLQLAVPGVPRRTSSGDLGDPRADYPGQVDHVLDVDITAR